jgi:hypothetical protein
MCRIYTHLPAYEDRTECSETSAYKLRMPGNYPEESIQHSEHCENLNSRMCPIYLHSKKLFNEELPEGT